MPAVKHRPELDVWKAGDKGAQVREKSAAPPVKSAAPAPRDVLSQAQGPARGPAQGPAEANASKPPLAAMKAVFGHLEGDKAAPTEMKGMEAAKTPRATAAKTIEEGDGGGGSGGNQEAEDPLVREQRLIQNALTTGPNAERAVAAYAEIERLRQENPEAASRLTPEMVAMLVNGVANPRSNSDRGQAGVLGSDQVGEAAEALLKMPEEAYAQLNTTLNQAGLSAEGQAIAGADAGAEQALILKSLASRRDALTGDPAVAAATMAEITQFGTTIRGTERDTLMARTTLLDIHDGTGGAAGNDDALRQTYTKSCAPSVAIMSRAEMDPMFAWKVQTGQIDAAQLQLDWMTEDGEAAMRREARPDGTVKDNAATGNDGTNVRGAYRFLGAAGAANIKDPQANRGATNIIGIDSSQTAAIDSALKEGQPVPLRTEAFGGHFMLATDVRGEGDAKQYLVTDPWTGKTAWVSETDLQSGEIGDTFGDSAVEGSLTDAFVEPY